MTQETQNTQDQGFDDFVCWTADELEVYCKAYEEGADLQKAHDAANGKYNGGLTFEMLLASPARK
jgi:hypothetical protein